MSGGIVATRVAVVTSRMGCIQYVTCALLLLCPLALTRHDDDFAFDNNEEFQVELQANHSEIAKNGLRRLWGVPDTSAYVGHLFRMEIPKEAFTGNVVAYKVRSERGGRIPNWMAVDTRHGLISGIPQRQDIGTHTFIVTAHGHTRGLTATDSFTIEVKKSDEKPHSKYGTCVVSQNRLVLIILIDRSFHQIPSKQRIRALMDLAHFMALDGDEFWIESYKAASTYSHSVLMSGPGTTQHKQSDATTAIYLNVGCGDQMWTRHKVLVAGIREQSRDGTLAHVLRLPVLGWRLVSVKPTPRPKRQSPLDDGSGNYDNYDGEDDAGDYSGYDDEDNEDDEYTNIDEKPDNTNNKIKITPYIDSASEATINKFSKAQLPDDFSHENTLDAVKERKLDTPHMPVLIVPEEPTTAEPETQTVIIRASNEIPTVSSSERPSSVTWPATEFVPLLTSPTPTVTSHTSVATTPTVVATTPTTIATVPTTVATTSSTSTTMTLPKTTGTTTEPTTTPQETTVQEVTIQESVTSTDRSSTIFGRTTETVTFTIPVNQPPVLKHHMKKLAITAGKAFRYIIPADLFTDAEDGTNLTFTMYETENVPLSKDHWIQFIPSEREVYGLPLESHVSRWSFIVEAVDSEGLSARGPLDITVQQHKSGRSINHQFIMQLKLNRDYTSAIDWQIRALEGIVNLFRDTDMDHLTVINTTKTGDLYEFVWTNDMLPKDTCTMDEVKRLMKIMESETEPGSPSAALVRAMSPDLKVSSVFWRAAGHCAREPVTSAPATRPPDTYPPVTRNQVDHLTATVGHLLVYKVPEDTFFDPEDGSTRNLHLSLRYSDRSEIPAGHWLQFDAKNQEFYGLPEPGDVGSVHYQLIAEDSSKKSAYDSLIVEVVKAPSIKPTVEFQMTMDPVPPLAYNANNKRKVVEKLAALFGQKETDNIRIHSFSDNPTTVTWFNTSLPMDRCPSKEIKELRNMVIADEKGSPSGALKDSVDHIFDKDLKVMSIRLIPLGLCADQNTKILKTIDHKPPTNVQNTVVGAAADHGYSEYLVTFIIPAVVIVCMILVAAVIACVLYRRRRTGKMSMGDDEERQAFRSKAPVIFQDELEERGDSEPVHKSPVIMREEKPPLLPPAPDYRSGEDAPYRPPPPFAANRTPPRPKATPTYRKPPPYVPP